MAIKKPSVLPDDSTHSLPPRPPEVEERTKGIWVGPPPVQDPATGLLDVLQAAKDKQPAKPWIVGYSSKKKFLSAAVNHNWFRVGAWSAVGIGLLFLTITLFSSSSKNPTVAVETPAAPVAPASRPVVQQPARSISSMPPMGKVQVSLPRVNPPSASIPTPMYQEPIDRSQMVVNTPHDAPANVDPRDNRDDLRQTNPDSNRGPAGQEMNPELSETQRVPDQQPTDLQTPEAPSLQSPDGSGVSSQPID